MPKPSTFAEVLAAGLTLETQLYTQRLEDAAPIADNFFKLGTLIDFLNANGIGGGAAAATNRARILLPNHTAATIDLSAAANVPDVTEEQMDVYVNGNYHAGFFTYDNTTKIITLNAATNDDYVVVQYPY